MAFLPTFKEFADILNLNHVEKRLKILGVPLKKFSNGLIIIKSSQWVCEYNFNFLVKNKANHFSVFYPSSKTGDLCGDLIEYDTNTGKYGQLVFVTLMYILFVEK